MLKVGILGPTGYAGLELIDILLRHPHTDIVYLGSRREELPHIVSVWPQLRGRLDMRCGPLDPDAMPSMDVAFVALPHTVAMGHVPALLAKGATVIDLSADYRLKDPATYERWYRTPHTDADRLCDAVYGLPEVFRADLPGAELVANPGCYPTAVNLAMAPLLASDLPAPGAPAVVDAKSGVSGAGRSPKPNLHFPEANEAVTAYKVGVHQHTGEMQQTFDRIAGRSVPFCFVPHLIPMDRGILATCYVPLSRRASDEDIRAIYDDFYRGAPFVRVLSGDELPSTKVVSHTNFCDIAVRVVGDHAVALSAIDNLVKGAAGQAVQNMNIVRGLDEGLGLL